MGSSRSSIMNFFIFAFTIISLGSTALVAILGIFSSFNVGGVFTKPVVNISDKYFTEVTPAPFVFATIWPIIFIWTILGSLYLLISLFLSEEKSPVKRTPALAPLGYLICNALAFGTCDAWYFAFDLETLGWAFALLLLCVVLICMAIGITLMRTYENTEELESDNKVTLWMVRIMVQNGLCVFATWITTATLLAFSVLLIYEDSRSVEVAQQRGIVDVETGSAIALGILLALVLVWFVAENFIWEKYLRYMFTIYPVFILAFSGLVVKLIELKATTNLVLASVNLSNAVLLFIARICLSIYRYHRRNRRYDDRESLDTKAEIAMEKF